MIKFEWKIDGRTVAPSQLGNELKKSLRKAVTTNIEQTVTAVRCPVHGRHATNVRAVPATGPTMTFQYEACCEELKAAIARSIQ